ncbi:MAG: DUF4126 domain-containing protein [Phycisphaerales bacterium]
METVVAVLAGLGLAAACGLRVFLPLAALSVGAKLGLIAPGETFAWVATWPAVVAFCSACIFEIAGYSIPSVDHGLDAIASPASVLAGGLVSATHLSGTASAELHPVLSACAALVVGGAAAGVVQAGTVSTRAVSTVGTAGLLNPVISAVQSAVAAVVSVLAVLLPVVVGAVALAVLALAGRWLAKRWLARRRSAAAVQSTSASCSATIQPGVSAR